MAYFVLAYRFEQGTLDYVIHFGLLDALSNVMQALVVHLSTIHYDWPQGVILVLEVELLQQLVQMVVLFGYSDLLGDRVEV